MSIALHKHSRTPALAGAARGKLSPAARAEAAARGGNGSSGAGEARSEPNGSLGSSAGGQSPPRPWLAPSATGVRPDEAGRAGAGGGTAADAEPTSGTGAATAGAAGTNGASGVPDATDPALQGVLANVRNKLVALADDPEAFHEALTKSFGDRYDKAAAETIRQQVLAGDFSWLPTIEVVDGATLGDVSGTQGAGEGHGAYSAETDTVYISRELLEGDPEKAASVLTEEIGHGLDTRLNLSDAAGDEGAIFSALVDGKALSDTDLAALQAENDSGTITIDGKEVEVEYSWLSKTFKKVKNSVKKVVKKVGDVITAPIKKAYELAKDYVEFQKKMFKKVMQSEILGTIMAVAQYIPIPIVAAVATVYNTVRAGYMVYTGIKEKSFATVLSGVAGLAGGASKLGASFGASAKFVKGAATISQRANQASKLYSLRGDVSFRNAAAVGADLFGGTKAGSYLKAVDRGFAARDAAKNGDVLGAVAIGADALRELPGTRYDDALGKVSQQALNGRSIVAAAKDKDYAGVIGLVNREYGTQLGLDETSKGHVDDLVEVVRTADQAVALARGDDYLGAAELLFDGAADRFSSPVVSGRFREGAEAFGKLGTIKTAADEGRLGSVAEGTLELLGQPLDEKTSGQLLDVLQSVDVLRGTLTDTGGEDASTLLRAADLGRGAYDASRRGDDLGALALGAEAFRALPGTRFDATLGNVSGTAIDARAVVALEKEGDTAGAISLANERFGTRLGLDEAGKARIDDLATLIGSAETAVSLADGDKDYLGAAAVLFDGASELKSTSPSVRARVEGGAQIFERLGNIEQNVRDGRLEDAAIGTLSLLGQPLDEKTRGRALDLLGSIDVLRGTAEVGDAADATPLQRTAGLGRDVYEHYRGGDTVGAFTLAADALRANGGDEARP